MNLEISVARSLAPREAVALHNKTQAPGAFATDVKLFHQFLDGNDAAFMELFDRHTHRLYMYCLKFVGDSRQAEDLMQDLWERVIRLRAEGREGIDNPVGFFVRIARNLCLNHIRDRKQLASIDDLPEWEHPKASVRELSHNEELVISALARLPESQREVLVLHAYSGYRFDEIAEMFNEQVGAVRTRAWRARMQLGRIISAFIGIDETREEDQHTSRERNMENEE